MGTSSIDIRRARTDDASGIAGVHDAAWRYTYRGILQGVDLERMIERRGPRWWEKAISRNVLILVVEMGGRLVGYATFGPSRMRALPYGGEIYELYLHPDYHGLGLGGRLLAAAMDMLDDRGLRGTVVRALKSNELAIGFYEHMGGRPVELSGERIGQDLVPVVIFGWPPQPEP